MKILLINLISGLLIFGVFNLILIFDYKNTKEKLKQIKLICVSALLVALAVTLNTSGGLILSTVLPFKIFEIKIGDFVLVLIGFFCGGMLGFASGIASDFLGLLFITNGTPALFFTLTSIVWCILPYYLVVNFSKIHYSNLSIYYYIPIAYGITSLLITSTDPLILKPLYSLPLPLWSMYLPRIIKYPIDLLVNSSLVTICYLQLNKTLNLQYQFKKAYFATDPQALEYNIISNK